MKLKQHLMILCSCLLLAGCGSSQDSTPNTSKPSSNADNLSISNVKIQLEGTDFYLYQPTKEVLKDWEPEKPVENLRTGKYKALYLINKKNDQARISVRVYNKEIEDCSLEDTIITEIYTGVYSRSNETFHLPKDVRLNVSSEEDVCKAIGYPLIYTQEEKDPVFIYKTAFEDNKAETMTIEFKDHRLDGITLHATGTNRDQPEKSFDPKSLTGMDPVAFSLNKPISSSLSEGILELEGIKIQKNTPIKTLIDQGWTTDWLSQHLDSTTIPLTKDKEKYMIDVKGVVNDIKDLTKEHVITSIDFNETSNIILPENITLGAEISDVINHYGTPFYLSYTDDQEVYVKYQCDNGMIYHLSFDKNKKLVHGIVSY